MHRGLLTRIAAGLFAAAMIVLALWQLQAAEQGVAASQTVIDGIPATVFLPEGRSETEGAVVIAHGFAGSQQLMRSFALAFARNGIAAVTFDFAGHGRNPQPMTGDLDDIRGATQRLVADLGKVVAHARGLGGGRIAVLGHSMASDIVVRYAQADPAVLATIAVSMYSPAVTATTPRNLLVIVGEWEGMLKREALRAVGLATAPRAAEPGVTYGDFAAGTARRAVFSPNVEHASVLFSSATLAESLAWVDHSFGLARTETPRIDHRGPAIALLFAGIVLLGWPLSVLLPRVATPPLGAGLGWRALWPGIVIPMLATPLILRVLPTHFLPVLVADYLTAHFLLYGLLTAAWLVFLRMRRGAPAKAAPSTSGSFAQALLPVLVFAFAGLVWPLDRFVTSFMPTGSRPMLVAVLLLGTFVYFIADEWLTRGPGAARGSPAASKLAFLCSLGLAVALDPPRLFFLAIIVPVIALFFIVCGLFSRWVYSATGHPLVAAFASALIFAWAIGVTFPLVSG